MTFYAGDEFAGDDITSGIFDEDELRDYAEEAYNEWLMDGGDE